jgi:hypothetical protein
MIGKGNILIELLMVLIFIGLFIFVLWLIYVILIKNVLKMIYNKVVNSDEELMEMYEFEVLDCFMGSDPKDIPTFEEWKSYYKENEIN